MTKSSIHIDPSKKGTFKAAATKAGKSVQEEASAVLNNPDASPAMKKKANFARNATKFNHSGVSRKTAAKVSTEPKQNTVQARVRAAIRK